MKLVPSNPAAGYHDAWLPDTSAPAVPSRFTNDGLTLVA